MTTSPPTEPRRSGDPRNGVVLLPHTDAGRALLRDVLPATRSPDRPDGELPDGSSIYGLDFDAAAEEAERDFADFERWLREQDQGGTR